MKPKHPMSAFFLFSKERREALLRENKNVLEVSSAYTTLNLAAFHRYTILLIPSCMHRSQISKIAGEEWKNMTGEQKAPYEEVYKNK